MDDILYRASTATANQRVNLPFSPLTRKNFKVIWDKRIDLAGNYTNPKGFMQIQKSFNFKSHSYCYYDGIIPSEAAITKGKYYLIYLADVPSGTGSPTMRYVYNFKFTDA